MLNHSYRHSESMIKKLESAGLGFFIKINETKQKLGMLGNTCVLYVHLLLGKYTNVCLILMVHIVDLYCYTDM